MDTFKKGIYRDHTGCTGFRDWGLGLCSPIMENQMERGNGKLNGNYVYVEVYGG